MKKCRKYLALLVVVVIAISSLTACGSNKNAIKATISNFEKACNEVDLNAMLACIDPKVSGKIEAVTGLASMFTDMGSEELLDALAELLVDDETLDADVFFSTIEITVGEIAVNEDSATAYAKVKYGAEETTEKNAVFECVCKEENWYISGFNFD